MKAVIVTVYDSVNSGSYWQARALKNAVENLGYEAVFLERRKNIGASSSIPSLILIMVMSALKYGISSSIRYYKISKAFRTANEKTAVISEKIAIDGADNIFILGSDTIWNTSSPYFMHNWDVYWGKIFFPHRVFSYAASAGNTSLEEISRIAGVKESILSWRDISVRDEHTKSIVEMISKRKTELVCDPTLLFDKTFYEKTIGVSDRRGYIFLYLFSRLDNNDYGNLAAFAKEKNLKIVIGSSHVKPAYCDEIIINSPDNFIRYMINADYIVTDTYHGTLFSVNFGKEFVTLDRGKKKVNEFLEMVGLSGRIKGKNESFSNMFAESVDYTYANSAIDSLRKKSWSFLSKAMSCNDENRRNQ